MQGNALTGLAAELNMGIALTLFGRDSVMLWGNISLTGKKSLFVITG